MPLRYNDTFVARASFIFRCFSFYLGLFCHPIYCTMYIYILPLQLQRPNMWFKVLKEQTNTFLVFPFGKLIYVLNFARKCKRGKFGQNFLSFEIDYFFFEYSQLQWRPFKFSFLITHQKTWLTYYWLFFLWIFSITIWRPLVFSILIIRHTIRLTFHRYYKKTRKWTIIQQNQNSNKLPRGSNQYRDKRKAELDKYKRNHPINCAKTCPSKTPCTYPISLSSTSLLIFHLQQPHTESSEAFRCGIRVCSVAIATY